MDLLTYRAETGATFVWLARRCGASSKTLSAIAHGRRRPSWKLAGALERETGGLIERAQWFPPLASPDTPQRTATRTPHDPHDTASDLETTARGHAGQAASNAAAALNAAIARRTGP